MRVTRSYRIMTLPHIRPCTSYGYALWRSGSATRRTELRTFQGIIMARVSPYKTLVVFWIWSNARTVIWFTIIWKIGPAAGGKFLEGLDDYTHFPKGFLALYTLIIPDWSCLFTTLLISDFLLVFLDYQVGIFKSEFLPKCSVKNSDLKSEFSDFRFQKILT